VEAEEAAAEANARDTRKSRASRRLRAELSTLQARATLTAAAPSTSQKCAG
jgi:hypothetical protein